MAHSTHNLDVPGERLLTVCMLLFWTLARGSGLIVKAKMEMMVGDFSCRRCRRLAAALTAAMDGRPRRETASLVIVLMFEMISPGTCTAAPEIRLVGHPGTDAKVMRTCCLTQGNVTFNY